MNRRSPVRLHSSAAINSLQILETIASLGPGTTAKDIIDALSMPSTTAYRLLNSLVGEEYLVRTSDLSGFALGHAITGLITATALPSVPTAARDVLEDFRGQTRFAVHLIAFQATSIKFADSDPDHPPQSEAKVLRYLHASAAGKLFLSQLDDFLSVRPERTLKKLTPRTMTTPDSVEDDLKEVRTRGYAVQVDELAEGRCCLAVPIALPGSAPRGAVCLGGAAERFDTITTHVPAAQQAAAQLAPLLF